MKFLGGTEMGHWGEMGLQRETPGKLNNRHEEEIFA